MREAIDWGRVGVRLGARGRVRCEPGWRLGPEWSDRLRDCDLWFVWAGRGEMWLRGDQRLALRPGVCLWMRPGGRYLAEQDPSDRLGVTYVHFDVLDPGGRPIRGGDRLPAEVNEVVDTAYVDAVLRRVVDLAVRHEAGAEALAQRLLTAVLVDLASGLLCRGDTRQGAGGTTGHHRAVVLQAAATIRESPGEVGGVGEIAAAYGYSADHFARLCKQVLGEGPQALIVRARVDRARQLLLESTLTVGQIADALGYRDVYFFSRQFKQRTGRSPTAFRQGRPVSVPGSEEGAPGGGTG